MFVFLGRQTTGFLTYALSCEFELRFGECAPIFKRQVNNGNSVRHSRRISDCCLTWSTRGQLSAGDITAKLWFKQGFNTGHLCQRKRHVYLKKRINKKIVREVIWEFMLCFVHAYTLLTGQGLKMLKRLHKLRPTVTDPKCNPGCSWCFSSLLLGICNWREGYFA